MPGGAESCLVLDEVSAGYGPTLILDKVSFVLPRSGTLAVLGRNGVGKTTLLATIMGHTTLHGGSLRLYGQDITRLPAHRRARKGLGWVPQDLIFF